MSSTIRQTLALIERYLIQLRRNAIKTIVRNLIWPVLLFGAMTYFLTKIAQPIDLIMVALQFNKELFCFVSFSVWHFTELLVNDKSSGIKFLMVSMGLTKRSYYSANIVSFLVPLFPYMAAEIWLVNKYTFTDSNYISIMIVISLFVAQITGIVLVSSLMLNRPNLAFIPSGLLLLDLIFTHKGVVWLLKHSNEYLWSTELFFACLSPTEAINIFSQSYLLCRNCDKTQYEKFGEEDDDVLVSQPTHLICLAMALCSFILYSIVYFFDQFSYHTGQNLKKKLNLKEFFGNSTDISQLPSGSLHIVELNVNNGYMAFENDDSNLTKQQYDNNEYFEQRDTSFLEIGIQVKNLTKKFNSIPVVNDVTFNIYKGETTLLLGHNGAGKTTLMNMILGKLRPNKGEVNVRRENDNDIGIGVCPQENAHDLELNVKQHLRLFAKIKTTELSNLEIEKSIQVTANEVGLIDQLNQLPSQLSGGMKRKLSLALASVGKSNILILDEPSSGLDPESRIHIWETIRKYRTNRTVLLSTQHMEEADNLGDRVAIMSEGKIICCGSSMFLKNTFGHGYKLRIQCDSNDCNKENVLTLVRKYFSQANFYDDEQGFVNSSREEMIIDLGTNSNDSETNMIELLEEIENHSDKFGIKSHGLRCSSIEDVLLETNNLNFSSNTQPPQIQIGATIGEQLEKLTYLERVETNYWSLYCALMKKHFHTFKGDWKSISFYRILIATYGIFFLLRSLNEYADKIRLPKPVRFLTGLGNTLMIAHLIYYPTTERCSKFKTMLLASNANLLLYWLAQLSADLLSLGPILIIDINIMLITYFPGEILISKIKFHLITSALVILFVFAASMLAYLSSKTFKTSSSCITQQSVYNCLPLSVNVFLLIIKLIQKSITEKIMDKLTYVFVAIFPTEAIEYIFYGFAKKCYVQSSKPTLQPCIVSNDVCSPILVGIFALFGQTIVYGLSLCFVEGRNLDLTVHFDRLFLFLKKLISTEKAAINATPSLDFDVGVESQKAFGLIDGVQRGKYSLVVAGLNKSYVKGINVVKDLSFTVSQGECFGLLGVNGAGKSTTFSMIAGEINHDQGKIWLNGHYNTESIDLYHQELGYNPQSNPEMSLSPIEALTLMARLRCVDEQAIPELVVTILELLEMTQHGRKCTKDLSGGTKRKLALGMSLIGNPRLLALDEPTAGVDPIARRSIWQLLRSLRSQNGTSILISSHAMEECEAICDRISIMARGQLACIGSFLHLRSKFSRDFSIKLQVDGQVNANKLFADFSRKLESKIGRKNFKMTDSSFNSATFILTSENVQRSTIFKILKEFKDNQAKNISFSLNDPSLEDIFITLAREQGLYS